jgi:hypothetical protein
MVRFVLDDHAQRRRARGSLYITWEMIDRVLAQPGEIRPARTIAGRPAAIIYIRALDGNRLRVYVKLAPTRCTS